MDLNELNNPEPSEAEKQQQRKEREEKEKLQQQQQQSTPQPAPAQLQPPHAQPPPQHQQPQYHYPHPSAEGYGHQHQMPPHMMSMYPPPPPPPQHMSPYGGYPPMMYPPYMQQYAPPPPPHHMAHGSPQPQPQPIHPQQVQSHPQASPPVQTQVQQPESQHQTPVKSESSPDEGQVNGEDGGSGSKSHPSSSSKQRQYHYTKRNHNRTYHTVVSGSKLRHLKKKDGEPLWRADIQYDFLRYVFENDVKAFKNVATGDENQTFADIYIDAMARSSKCSKILRDKLRGDRSAGINMALVCLLVNIGRMNTTLNFFPEMKARLRTYHPIPSLQTYSDHIEYKQLQDAPRLKSILKGACEDTEEPITLDDLLGLTRIPKTNPINLVFLMSTYEPKVTQLFFDDQYDFFDLIMTSGLSSESRGRAFLWLMWAFLQTNLTKEELQKNPFGMGTEDGTKVPELVVLNEEQIALENVDTPDEKIFGYNMEKERSKYLDATSNSALDTPTAGRGSGGRSALHSTPNRAGPYQRSTPASNRSLRSRDKPNYKYNYDEAEDETVDQKRSPSPQPKKPKGRRGGKPGAAELRQQKCFKEVEKMLVGKDRRRRRQRYTDGPIKRTWEMIKDIDPIYNSEDEAAVGKVSEGRNQRKSGASSKRESTRISHNHPSQIDDYTNVPVVNTGRDDYGEEATALTKSFRRAERWIRRWKTGQMNGHYHKSKAIKLEGHAENEHELEHEQEQEQEHVVEPHEPHAAAPAENGTPMTVPAEA